MNKKYLRGKEKRNKKVINRIKADGKKIRLSVYRSNRYIYAQIINDKDRKTLIAVSEKMLKTDSLKKQSKTEKARLLGQLLGEKATTAKIKEVVFDRGSYRYHGRVRALAEGARNAGLKF